MTKKPVRPESGRVYSEKWQSMNYFIEATEKTANKSFWQSSPMLLHTSADLFFCYSIWWFRLLQQMALMRLRRHQYFFFYEEDLRTVHVENFLSEVVQSFAWILFMWRLVYAVMKQAGRHRVAQCHRQTVECSADALRPWQRRPWHSSQQEQRSRSAASLRHRNATSNEISRD